MRQSPDQNPWPQGRLMFSESRDYFYPAWKPARQADVVPAPPRLLSTWGLRTILVCHCCTPPPPLNLEAHAAAVRTSLTLGTTGREGQGPPPPPGSFLTPMLGPLPPPTASAPIGQMRKQSLWRQPSARGRRELVVEPSPADFPKPLGSPVPLAASTIVSRLRPEK